MSMIAPAYAQAAGGVGGGGIESFLPLILIFVVFYFLLIRPQQKKVKQQREMLSAIRRGDRVVTGGGIVGLITKVVNDQEVIVEIADNVRVKVLRDTIATVLTKTEPVAGGGKNKAEAEGDAEGGETSDSGPAAPEDNGVVAGLKKLLSGKGK
ncbi:MAG: preprotein translocase subunit YajC [Alphaproteobacteria bacterium]|nr:preprotein translocase subunit YajC [Alphaproteobacteria bacterium]